MAKLTKEQIQELNKQINSGTTLTTVHNTKYHFIIKINTEGIVVQSMLADDMDKGIMLNLEMLRNEYDNSRTNKESDPNDAEALSQETLPTDNQIS